MTLGEAYGPAMEIRSQEEADVYFKKLVDDSIAEGDPHPREVIEEILRDGLGYYAGYYDNETRLRVERFFQCEHPILGKFVMNGAPTLDEAFRLGGNVATKTGPQTLTEMRKEEDDKRDGE
jgi:hypothetical protein